MSRQTLTSFLVILSFLSPMVADEVVFTNGDRLTGTVVEMDQNTVRFRSNLIGEVVIQRLMISKLETDFELEPTDTKADHSKATTDGGIEPRPTLTKQTENFVIGMIRPYSPFGWSGSVSLGANLDRAENTEKALRFNLDATKIIDENEYKSGLYYDFKETEESTGTTVKDTDRYGGYFGYTRKLPGQFLLTGDTRAFANQVQEVDFQYDAALLVGRRFERIENLVLQFDVGRTATYLNPAFGESDWSFLWEVRETLEYRFADAFRLEQSFRYQIDPNDTDRDALFWDISAILRMNEWMNTVFSYEFERSRLATSGRTEEERLSASLAFPF